MKSRYYSYFAGVVHLASTESTGGSTTGDDEESSDQAQPSLDRVLLETRRNTHQNESIANSYRQAQEKLGFSDADTSNNENQNGANVFTENSTGSGTSSTAAAGGQSGACSSLYPPSLPASFPSQSTRSSKHRYEYCLRKTETNSVQRKNPCVIEIVKISIFATFLIDIPLRYLVALKIFKIDWDRSIYCKGKNHFI